MNEAQVRTLEHVRQVVAGTQGLEFRGAEDDQGRYAWIGQVLLRFGYRQMRIPMNYATCSSSNPSLFPI